MRALLYGKYGEHPESLDKEVENAGVEVVKENPELVITFGGDGTLLGAERDYPGIPKLPLRDSKFCHVCAPIANGEVIKLLVKGELNLKEFSKLEAVASDKRLTALNDVVLRNKLPNSALRFEVEVNNDGKIETFVDLTGDGVVVATVFGATGYYQSITKQVFESGFGLAFNNLHSLLQDAPNKIILGDNFEVKVTIDRGPAILAADNNPEMVELNGNRTVIIKKSSSLARIYLV